MTCLPEGIARHLHVKYIKLLLNFLLLLLLNFLLQNRLLQDVLLLNLLLGTGDKASAKNMRVITECLIIECFTTEFEFAFSSIKYA